jgi:hypothetical protein
MKDLSEQLRDLDNARNPHRRGRLFEPFISQILEEEGYSVSFNPKSAPPRQTDLFALREEHSFLIEAKWLRKPAHVGHVSSVRERLRKCPPGVYGCIFSMSGYTAEAIQEMCNDRNPEIVLFNGTEIRGIASGALSFTALLERKKKEIRRNAVAWFSDWTPEKVKGTRLRSGPDTLRIDGKERNSLFSTTRDHDVIFATELLDCAGTHHSSVFSLNLTLNIYTVDDLHRFIQILKKHIGLAGEESFAIHQRNAGWYGVGTEAFLCAVKNWESRYAELKWGSYHHSEELAYFDRLEDGGLVCLTSRQRVGDEVYLHSSYVEAFFPGIPVDMSAIRRLCELAKNPDAKLENVHSNPVETLTFHPRVPVEAVGSIVSESDGAQFVSGLIVKNPFFGKQVPLREKPSRGEPLKFLSNNEYLLCSMKQWHVLGNQKVKYEIRYAEACWIEHIPVLHIACDWSDENSKRTHHTTPLKQPVSFPGPLDT